MLNNENSKLNFENTLKNTITQAGIAMHGNAYFIRAVKSIDNKQEFFQAIDIDGNATNWFDHKGFLNINNELVIHPISFMQLSKEKREKIIKYSTDLFNGEINEDEFNDYVKDIKTKDRIIFKNQLNADRKRLLDCENLKFINVYCVINFIV